jgi:hypothetical protein
MKPVTESEIRASFVNCSKGEARRLGVPSDLGGVSWDDLDFLGWREAGAPQRAYLVTERDGDLVGVVLRVATGTARGFTARSMCSLCLTTHTSGGVSLMTAPRVGAAGRQGNSVGTYLCGDLGCSLYVRGKKQSVGFSHVDASLTVAEKAERLRSNLHLFLDKITAVN